MFSLERLERTAWFLLAEIFAGILFQEFVKIWLETQNNNPRQIETIFSEDVGQYKGKNSCSHIGRFWDVKRYYQGLLQQNWESPFINQ